MKSNKAYIFISLAILAYLLNNFIYNKVSSIPYLTSFAFLLITFATLQSYRPLVNGMGVALTFLLLLEVFYFLCFGEQISNGVLDSIIETNKNELLGMMSVYIWIIILPALLLAIFACLVFRKKKHKIKPKTACCILIALYSFPLFSTASSYLNNGKLKAEIKEDRIAAVQLIKRKFPVVFGSLAYIFFSTNKNNMYSNTDEIEDFNSSIISAKKPKNKIVVLIMGESSLFSRYSAYGYNIKTTPNIDKIFNSPNGCVIKKAHSSAPITRNSVSMTLSFYTPENNENLFKNKSIIEMAKSNKYQTYWIGSQPLKGLHDSKYGFIAKKSNHVFLTNFKDDELPLLFNKVLHEKKENKFIVVHLWGNHQPYKNFDDEDRKALPNTENYDSTIHHTDRVIGSLYTHLRNLNKNYILLYTSDHGEIVNKGHGFEDGVEQFLIPFLYKSSNPKFGCNFIESFRNSDGWLSGLMNKYILANLLGFQVDSNVVEREKNYDRILNVNEEVQLFSNIK